MIKLGVVICNVVLSASISVNAYPQQRSIAKQKPIANGNGTIHDLKANKLPRIKDAILLYFSEVISQGKIIVGQQVGDGMDAATGYTRFLEGLDKQTGKTPALAGFRIWVHQRKRSDFD